MSTKAAQLQAQRARGRGWGRGATAWRPWADRGWSVEEAARWCARHLANGRDAVAPLPKTGISGWRLAVRKIQRETGDRIVSWGVLCPQQTFRSPFECRHAPTANRYPPTASTFARGPYFPSAALIDFTTALPRTAEPSALKWTSALFCSLAISGATAAWRSSIATPFSFMTLRAMSL